MLGREQNSSHYTVHTYELYSDLMIFFLDMVNHELCKIELSLTLEVVQCTTYMLQNVRDVLDVRDIYGFLSFIEIFQYTSDQMSVLIVNERIYQKMYETHERINHITKYVIYLIIFVTS